MNPQKIPSSFIEENKDIFLINTKVPDEVKERFFKRELTIEMPFKHFLLIILQIIIL